MVAGSPVSVQSPARNRLFQPVSGARPQGVLLRRGREGGAALAHDLPRRQIGLRRPATLQTSRQIACGEFLARHVDQPVAVLMVTDSRLREREQPFHRPPTTPRIAGMPRRRIDSGNAR